MKIYKYIFIVLFFMILFISFYLLKIEINKEIVANNIKILSNYNNFNIKNKELEKRIQELEKNIQFLKSYIGDIIINNTLDSQYNNIKLSKDNIVTTDALNILDIKICNKISIKGDKIGCRNEIYYTKAINKLDNKICNKIKNNTYYLKICIKDVKDYKNYLLKNEKGKK